MSTILTIFIVLASLMATAQVQFDKYFTNNTFRFDYFHSGNTDNEQFSPDALLIENMWAGSKTKLIDTNRLGLYKFEIIDTISKKVIYSQGFASIFGEWQTTGEAKKTWRTFHESARFPEPRQPFTFVMKKRNDDGSYTTLYTATVDPASRFVQRPVFVEDRSSVILNSGDINKKVDVLILADGYAANEEQLFLEDVKRLTNALFQKEPYKSRKNDFNVRAVFTKSAENGITNPRSAVWKTSALSLSFNAFDSDRYVLTYDNKAVRNYASATPYDALVLIFNDDKYGGGGIYNLWATVAARNSFAEYLFIHEFGHSFASLADEYYSSPVSYEEVEKPDYEPFDRNVTALLDPKNIKWKEFVDPKTPLPTPWKKAEYDSIDRAYQKTRALMLDAKATEAEMDSLFYATQARSTKFLKNLKYYGKVGAFEGAGYRSTGYYRPEADCVMFTRNEVPFCRVCQQAINEIIDGYTE